MAKAKRPPQTKKKLGGPRVSEGGPRQAKADAVAAVQERLAGSSAVVLTEYRGMTVHELAELRSALREANADYKVYKNTLATIAAKNLGLEELTPYFEGPTAFAFASGDPVVVAKRLADFAKKVPTLVLKGGVLEGKVLSGTEIGALSKLDSREVMLAKAAGMLLSPIQKLANLFAAPLTQLGSMLVQLRDKLPGEALAEEVPPAEAPAEAVPAVEAPATEVETPAEQPESPATESSQADESGPESPAAESAPGSVEAAPETSTVEEPQASEEPGEQA